MYLYFTKISVEERRMHPPLRGTVSDKFKANIAAEQTAEYWRKVGIDTLKRHKEELLNVNQAKNVIFFLGDGMSLPTLAAARAYIGQREGNPGEEYQLSFEKFPATGLSKVYLSIQHIPSTLILVLCNNLPSIY